MSRLIYGQYLIPVSRDSGHSYEGVTQKVADQLNVMQSHGIACELTEVVRPRRSTLWKALEYYLPMWPDRTTWSFDLVNPKSSFVYIRRPYYVSRNFLRFLGEVKRRNPRLFILLEVPTYPYEKEYPLKSFGARVKDSWNRRKLSRYVDNIVDLSGRDKLFGVDTIKITNGTPVRDEFKRVPGQGLEEIRMVCAGNFSFWHGLDRLISGIAAYYRSGGSRKLSLTIIGGGDELARYKSQVEELHLEGTVRFLGVMDRDDVLKSYSNYNLGVESLARHRTGDGGVNSSLKSRDYLNAGLPFFGEGKVDVLVGREFPYYYEVPSDDSPIDLHQIIDFFDGVYSSSDEQDVIDRIHNFALKTVDIQVAYKPIVDAIQSGAH